MKTPTLIPIIMMLLLPLSALSQRPTDDQINLVGNRFRPLTWEEMTPAQQTMTQSLLAGPRSTMGGPFNVLLRSPEMGDVAQQLGAYARFNTTLGDSLREMAIIMTARFWTADYEWYAHKNAALAAGLSPGIIDAIAEGRQPPAMDPEEQALYDFCRQLLYEHRVDDAVYATAVETFGESGVVDIIGILGWYSMVSLLLNTDEYPLPEGVAPELAPLP